jgi:hypothetical protein
LIGVESSTINHPVEDDFGRIIAADFQVFYDRDSGVSTYPDGVSLNVPFPLASARQTTGQEGDELFMMQR